MFSIEEIRQAEKAYELNLNDGVSIDWSRIVDIPRDFRRDDVFKVEEWDYVWGWCSIPYMVVEVPKWKH